MNYRKKTIIAIDCRRTFLQLFILYLLTYSVRFRALARCHLFSNWLFWHFWFRYTLWIYHRFRLYDRRFRFLCRFRYAHRYRLSFCFFRGFRGFCGSRALCRFRCRFRRRFRNWFHYWFDRFLRNFRYRIFRFFYRLGLLFLRLPRRFLRFCFRLWSGNYGIYNRRNVWTTFNRTRWIKYFLTLRRHLLSFSSWGAAWTPNARARKLREHVKRDGKVKQTHCEDLFQS